MSRSSPGWRWSAAVCLLLLATSFGVFFNSLSNDFVFDDHLAIVNNPDTDPFASYADLWRHDIWGKDLLAHDSHRSYRPLLVVTFKVLRSLFGLKAMPIRIASILSHSLTSMLVYFVGLLIFSNWHLSIASSLLFSVHPVHVESVAAVVNIAEPLSCIFFCLALLMYLSSVEDSQVQIQDNSVAMIGSTIRWGFQKVFRICLWIVFLAVSILFKETTITLLGVVFIISVSMVAATYFRKVFYREKGSSSLGVHFQWIFLSLTLLVVYFVFRAYLVSERTEKDIVSLDGEECESYLGAILLWLSTKLDSALITIQSTLRMLRHLFVSPFASLVQVFVGNYPAEKTSGVDFSSFYLDDSALIRKAENPYAFLQGKEKVLSLMYLHFRYFWLLVWPVKLAPEYAFNCIPSVASIEDNGNYRAISAICLYLSLGVLILKSLLDMMMKTTKSISVTHNVFVSTVLLVVPFVPASGVFLRLGTLLAERLLYVPSIGFCYLLCLMLFSFSKIALLSFGVRDSLGKMKRSLFWGLVMSIFVFYSARTLRRNMDWKTDESLFLSSLDVCPNSAKLNLQVTKLYLNKGDYEMAEKHIEATKMIDPDFCDVWYQEALMNILYYNDMDEAISKLTDSLQCVFTNSGALQVLTNIWSEELKKSPKDFSVYERIGDVSRTAEMYSVSVQHYQQGALLATEQGKLAEALGLLKKTEKVVKKFYDSALFDGVENVNGKLSYLYREMSCNMYGLGGFIRTSLLGKFGLGNVADTSEQSRSRKKAAKVLLQEIKRREIFLSNSLRPECVYEVRKSGEVYGIPSEVTGIVLSNYALTVFNMHLDTLSSRLKYLKQLAHNKEKPEVKNGVKKSDLQYVLAESSSELAITLERGAKLYEEVLRLKLNRYYENLQLIRENKTDANKHTSLQEDLQKDVFEAKNSRITALSTSLQLHIDSGEEYMAMRNYSKAVASFEYACNVTERLELKDYQHRKDIFRNKDMVDREIWLGEVIADKNLLPPPTLPCRVYYLRALALTSSNSSYLHDEGLRKQVYQMLIILQHCEESSGSVTSEMLKFADENMRDIEFFDQHIHGRLDDP